MPFANLTPQQQADVLAGKIVTVKKEPDKKQKLATSPAKRTDGAEPWHMFGWIDRLGGQEVRMLDPKNPTAYFLEKLHPNGSTETHESSDAEGAHTNHLHPGHHREYVAKGKNTHTDGNHGTQTKQNMQTDASKDHGSSAGNNRQVGTGKQVLSGSGQGSFNNNTGGETFHTSSGDIIHSHDGNLHQDHDGDHIRKITGNSIEMVGTGDHGIHVQSGNFDLTATAGKGQIKTGQLLTITSSTRIRLEVGSSYIDIAPAGIEIGTDGFVNVFVNKGSENLSIINYGSGRAQMGTNGGEATIAGNSIVLKSKTGTTIEKGPTIPPLPWGGVTK